MGFHISAQGIYLPLVYVPDALDDFYVINGICAGDVLEILFLSVVALGAHKPSRDDEFHPSAHTHVAYRFGNAGIKGFHGPELRAVVIAFIILSKLLGEILPVRGAYAAVQGAVRIKDSDEGAVLVYHHAFPGSTLEDICSKGSRLKIGMVYMHPGIEQHLCILVRRAAHLFCARGNYCYPCQQQQYILFHIHTFQLLLSCRNRAVTSST